MKSEEREYSNTRFPAEVIKEAVAAFDQQANPAGKHRLHLGMSVVIDNAERGHDDEQEFFADYRKSPDSAYYHRWYDNASFRIRTSPFGGSGSSTRPLVSVHIEAERWPQILAVFDVFEANKHQSLLPEEPIRARESERPVLFIGHGPTDVWKELRDHLRDKQGFNVVAYEIGARAGHAIRDILEGMAEESSLAFLVMTGDDTTLQGELHPRLNVVREAGFFQGRLGFNRAIVLLQNGVTEFSNIHGIEQIRFDNIKEILGDVIATIRREFPDA
jgi:hypothetical protein